MHTIEVYGDEEQEVCVIKVDNEGLQILKEMIEMKIKMGNHCSETIICKDFKGNDFKLRFDLVE